jgi:hypothetical protein
MEAVLRALDLKDPKYTSIIVKALETLQEKQEPPYSDGEHFIEIKKVANSFIPDPSLA